MKTICVDARMINHSGIGVYTTYYINFLVETGNFQLILIGNKKLIAEKIKINSCVKILESNFSIYSLKELILFPFLIPTCDLYWSPHYNAPIFPTRAKKILITIPDIAHIKMAAQFNFGLLKKLYSKTLILIGLLKSDLVITISEFSKKEICKYYDISKKLKVVLLGIDHSIFTVNSNENELTELNIKYNIPKNYILFVGNVKPHKNLKNLVLAFEKIIETRNDIFLLIIGKKEGFISGDTDLFDYINSKETLQSRIRFTGFVIDSDLPKIYRQANIFAFPSIYEGFGFPPLEAMASGCPVVASTAASIPEICGEAVKYFDPLNPDEMADSIIEILDNEELRKQYIQKGLSHVKKYNWRNSGKEFLNVIESI